MKGIDKLTPRELLVLLAATAHLANRVRKEQRKAFGTVAPAKGPRGLKRRAKRRRSNAKLMRERRSTLASLNDPRSIERREKREAAEASS